MLATGGRQAPEGPIGDPLFVLCYLASKRTEGIE